MLLNRENIVLGIYFLSKGDVSGTFADLKLTFGVALKCNASGIILEHRGSIRSIFRISKKHLYINCYFWIFLTENPIFENTEAAPTIFISLNDHVIKLYVFMVPNILVNKFISEIYPFTPEEVYTYRERVDFKYLSKNRNLDWTYQLIKQFENDWDWESLDQNISVFKKLTLGLLFPERIRLQECDCFFQMNFCEREDCHHNWKKFLEASSLEDDFPEIFWRMRILLESDAIDAEMIKSYYNSDNPDEVIKLELELQ